MNRIGNSVATNSVPTGRQQGTKVDGAQEAVFVGRRVLQIQLEVQCHHNTMLFHYLENNIMFANRKVSTQQQHYSVGRHLVSNLNVLVATIK